MGHHGMTVSAGNNNQGEPTVKPARLAKLRIWAPLIVLAALTVLAFALGWNEHLSFRTIGLNYEALRAFIDAYYLIALSIFTLSYVILIALSLPGGLIMTVAGGLLFGWVVAVPASIIGATTGATIVFLAAKTSLGEALAAKATPWLCRLREGFKADALCYLLFLRLVPAFPFCVVNLVPALLGVPLRTYVLATSLGIIPGTFALAVAGSGLASVIEAQNAIHRVCLAENAGDAAVCPYTVDTSALITNELLFAFALLGIVALIPVLIKKWTKRDAIF